MKILLLTSKPRKKRRQISGHDFTTYSRKILMLILMLILIYKELLKINMTKHNRIIDKENSQYREKNVKVAKKMFPKETQPHKLQEK